MSINNQVLFDLKEDEYPNEYEYGATDVQYVYINDNNNANYAGGWVNFNNQSFTGKTANTFLNWSGGYLAVPISVWLVTTDPAACAFYDGRAENALALSLKGSHNLFPIVDQFVTKENLLSLIFESYLLLTYQYLFSA